MYVHFFTKTFYSYSCCSTLGSNNLLLYCSGVNNQPVAVNDQVITTENVHVNIKILANDKDSNDDKLKIMGVSPSRECKRVTNENGSITYFPEKSWAGREVFSYTVGDAYGGIAAASVEVAVEPGKIINNTPEAQDQTISVNENSPERIGLKARDADDGDKLVFKIVEKPSHGKIAELSGSEGTLIYLPDSARKTSYQEECHDEYIEPGS